MQFPYVHATDVPQPSVSEALAVTASFLAQDHGIIFDSINTDVIDQIRDEVTMVADELILLGKKTRELKARLEEVWVDSAEVEYELTSVFIHRGNSPTFGHYFFYARHLPHFPDRWFKYNDAEVTEVPNEEVFADTTGQTANPYWVICHFASWTYLIYWTSLFTHARVQVSWIP
jgi:ubiquitin carboxyl-terminal hydrolase 25/28